MKTTKRIIIPFFIAYIILAILAFLVLPANDDWNCGAYPRFDFTWGNLLPEMAFWRPIENVIGGFLGLHPTLFPYLNHLIIILLYTLNGWLIYSILQRLGVSINKALIAAIAILILPGGMSALFSVDSINQVGAVTFGLLSLYFLLSTLHLRTFAWLFCAIISLLFKESGIVWLIISPLIVYILDKTDIKSLFNRMGYKNLIIQLLLSSIIILVYFIIRNHYNDPNYILPENYRLKLSYNIFLNLGLLLGSSLTTLDSMALFIERKWIFVIASILCSIWLLLVLIQIVFSALKDKNKRIRNILWLLIIILASSPHLVMRHCGELHSYSTIAMSIIVLVYFAEEYYKKQKNIILCLMIFGIASLCVDAHKWYYIYEQGQKGHRLAIKIDAQQNGNSDRVLIIKKEIHEKSYSSFLIPTYSSFGNGDAYKWLKKYKYPKYILCKELKANKFNYNTINSILLNSDRSIQTAWLLNKDSILVIKDLPLYIKDNSLDIQKIKLFTKQR